MVLVLLRRQPQSRGLSSLNSSCLTQAAAKHLKTRMGKHSSRSREGPSLLGRHCLCRVLEETDR